jgi:hypothetical protein
MGAPLGQHAGGLEAEPGVAAGDDGGAPGQIGDIGFCPAPLGQADVSRAGPSGDEFGLLGELSMLLAANTAVVGAVTDFRSPRRILLPAGSRPQPSSAHR